MNKITRQDGDSIIIDNLNLPIKYKGKSPIDMIREQESLIKKYEQMGFTRREFFERSIAIKRSQLDNHIE